MDFTTTFEPNEAVFRISLNLEHVHTADAAMRTWLPLVTELHPLAAEFSTAPPSGLRTGFMADLLVARPLPEGVAPEDGPVEPLRALLDTLGAPDLKVTRDDTEAKEARAKQPSETLGGTGPYGAYLVFAAVGYDPLNPDGDTQEYEDDDDI
ncbi:hypothetical protein AAH978_16445 [Streptomyces sp. ZYX-F-203]